MGLQNQLSDVSIMVLMVVLIAKSVTYLHSLLLTILHNLEPHRNRGSLNDVVGAGLANLIVLCEQLNLNRACSYPNPDDSDANCVVCLDRFGQRDHVRRLPCRHVFHKELLCSSLHETEGLQVTEGKKPKTEIASNMCYSRALIQVSSPLVLSISYNLYTASMQIDRNKIWVKPTTWASGPQYLGWNIYTSGPDLEFNNTPGSNNF